MYQVELTTDMDVVSIVVNASDENEAISIALKCLSKEKWTRQEACW